MSLEFLQLRMPCEECIIQAICKDKYHTSDISINKSISYCLVLPDWDMKEKVYPKGLLECLINITWDVIEKISREKMNNNKTSIPNQYIDMLISITATLQWMINSSSWYEGELYGFDASEIKSKLKNVTHWLDNAK